MGNQDWATGPPGCWATGPSQAVGRGPVFSKTPTTATKVPLTESLLDNWLKNNHITIDKIYYLSSLFVSFFTKFSVFFSFLSHDTMFMAQVKLKYIGPVRCFSYTT